MQQEPDDPDRSLFIIAYMAVAFSGAFMGFLIGLFVGWLWWA